MSYIHVFSRKQAIEEGDLVDVTSIAKEVGIRFPVAITNSVWQGVIELDETAKESGESIQGRLWDVLFMFSIAARKNQGNILFFTTYCSENGILEERKLKGSIGPGDDLEPVITIMYPIEENRLTL